MSEGNELLFDVTDGIATVTINRPEQRNAMNIAVSNGLNKIWEDIDLNPDIRVVIFTSADCGTFCAGMDLKETAQKKAETGEDILTFMRDPFQKRMRHVRVPIIAAMSGLFSMSWETTVQMTWVSHLKPFGNSGRIGRSIRRDVRVSLSPGRFSLFKKPPGILPAA